MSEIDSVKLGLQSLATDVQMLSASIKQASLGIQRTSTDVASRVQSVSAGVQGGVASAMAPMYRGSPQGFQGLPTGLQNSGGQPVPINGQKDSPWRNLFTSAGNNEYNKPVNWWRDLLAVNGKEFMDVSAADAKKSAQRNWERRAARGAYDAASLAAAYIPGIGLPLSIGMELAKPLVFGKSDREYEYWNMLDKTGGRNVTAAYSNTSEGGFTDREKTKISEGTAHLYKGMGIKKSQQDEMMMYAEQYGLYKTYERTTVDQQIQKRRKSMEDAKYAMQALHTSAEESMKILGDLNKMGGKPAGTLQISLLNRASAYSGLSPMQMHEYAMGRSEYFKDAGYGKKEGYGASLRELTNYLANAPQGKPPNAEGVIGAKQALASAARGTEYNALMAAFVKNKDGTAVFDTEAWNKYQKGNMTIKEQMELGRKNIESMSSSPELQAMVASGGLQKILPKLATKAGILPELAENIKSLQSLQTWYVESGAAGKNMDASLWDLKKKSPDKFNQALATISAYAENKFGFNLSIDDLGEVLNNTDLMSRENIEKTSKERAIGMPEKKLTGSWGKKMGEYKLKDEGYTREVQKYILPDTDTEYATLGAKYKDIVKFEAKVASGLANAGKATAKEEKKVDKWFDKAEKKSTEEKAKSYMEDKYRSALLRESWSEANYMADQYKAKGWGDLQAPKKLKNDYQQENMYQYLSGINFKTLGGTDKAAISTMMSWAMQEESKIEKEYDKDAKDPDRTKKTQQKYRDFKKTFNTYAERMNLSAEETNQIFNRVTQNITADKGKTYVKDDKGKYQEIESFMQSLTGAQDDNVDGIIKASETMDKQGELNQQLAFALAALTNNLTAMYKKIENL